MREKKHLVQREHCRDRAQDRARLVSLATDIQTDKWYRHNTLPWVKGQRHSHSTEKATLKKKVKIFVLTVLLLLARGENKRPLQS